MVTERGGVRLLRASCVRSRGAAARSSSREGPRPEGPQHFALPSTRRDSSCRFDWCPRR